MRPSRWALPVLLCVALSRSNLARASNDDVEMDYQEYVEEGYEALKGGNSEEASRAFNSAIVLDPKNPEAIEALKEMEKHREPASE